VILDEKAAGSGKALLLRIVAMLTKMTDGPDRVREAAPAYARIDYQYDYEHEHVEWH
jgi:ABC-type polar amino acid transport system ATPase subunit